MCVIVRFMFVFDFSVSLLVAFVSRLFRVCFCLFACSYSSVFCVCDGVVFIVCLFCVYVLILVRCDVRGVVRVCNSVFV